MKNSSQNRKNNTNDDLFEKHDDMQFDDKDIKKCKS